MAIRLLSGRKDRPTPDAMTLAEHLGELRRRVIICAVAFVVAATLAVVFYQHDLDFLQAPYCRINPGRGSLGRAAPSTSPPPSTACRCG